MLLEALKGIAIGDLMSNMILEICIMQIIFPNTNNYLESTIFYYSQYNGGRWCFVENNIGNGYSTCPDTTQSQRFLGESWSYLACISPQQSSLQCQHCNTIRSRVAAGPFNAFPTLPVDGPGQAFPPGTVVGPWRTVYSNRPSYNIHK